jgi:Putative amidoligase enzyme
MKLHELFIKKKTSQLNEVNMSPGALQDWSKKYATGMNAGFEAELCFRDLLANNNDDDFEPQEDYNDNRRCRDIDTIINFFSESMDERSLDNLRDQLQDAYHAWADEEVGSSWRDKEDELVKEYIEENDWNWDEKIKECLENQEDLTYNESDIDRAIEVGNQYNQSRIYDSDKLFDPKSVKTELQLYVYGKQLADDLLDETVQLSIARSDRNYEKAREYFEEEAYDDYSVSDWLDGKWMDDIYENYRDVSWPYWTSPDEDYDSGDGRYNFDKAKELAELFREKFGFKTLVIRGTRSEQSKLTTPPDTWVFESDGSIDSDSNADMPIEIVAPYYPLETTLELMPKFFAWVKGLNGYTNETTGLHMSVSMAEHRSQDLDFVKTVLFLGDDYVLDQFDREGNTYCQNSLKRIKERSLRNDSDGEYGIESQLDNLRHGLDRIAANSLATAKGFGKYYTVHPKEKYIEFRSAGGNYINDFPKIQSTLRRYALAMSLGMSRGAEAQEYAKKLYKILGNVQFTHVRSDTTFGPPSTLYKKGAVAIEPMDNNAVWYFSQYVAGLIDRRVLVANIQHIQRGRATQRSRAQPDAFTVIGNGESVLLDTIDGNTIRRPYMELSGSDGWSGQWTITNSASGRELDFSAGIDNIAAAVEFARNWIRENINAVHGTEFQVLPIYTQR